MKKNGKVETLSISPGNFHIPGAVLVEIRRAAAKGGMSPDDVLRKALKFYLSVVRMTDEDPTTKVIIRQGNTDRIILDLINKSGAKEE